MSTHTKQRVSEPAPSAGEQQGCKQEADRSLIGRRLIKPDNLAKVTGAAQYTADICVHRKDLLYAKAKFPPYGHARIKGIDTAAAKALDGVEAVMTAADLPGSNRYGGMVHDKPVLAEDKVIYEGDAVAIVAAKDLATAKRAIDLIKVEYEPLPPCDDPRKMLEPDAPLLHENHPAAKGNISDTVRVEKGDTDDAFAKADIIIENDYETPMLDHAYLEPDICLAEPDPIQGGIVLYSPQHAVQLAKKALCGVFDLPQSKIRVVSHIVGGGFGGKEDSTFDVSAVAGVLALKTGKPVVYEFTRDEVFKNTGKRHAAFIRHRLAADREGNLLGIDVFTVIDKGAYKSIDAIPNRTAMYAGGAYHIPAAKTLSHSVFTNHPYGCAFRGLGSPQAHFAMECQMDELARKLGMDPVELRLKNILRHGDRTIFNQVIRQERGLGLEDCICKVRDALQWETPCEPGSDRAKKRGKGIACFLYGTGTGAPTDGAHCVVQAQPDGSINVALSSNELGQGLIVAMAQIAAEAMGVPYDMVSVDYSDSAASLEAGATVASRTTVLMGNAIIAGCNILRERFVRVAAPGLHADPQDIDIRDGKMFVRGKPETAIPLAGVIKQAFASQVPLAAIGTWYPPMTYPDALNQNDKMHAYTFGAHGVEIEVDTGTGEITILRSVLACDLGKAINPSTVEGQMEGGSAQGIGWAIMEEEFMRGGKMQNHTYHDFLIPTAMDLPPLETILVEHPNELGPYGAKGIGEPPLVGTAPAVRNALWAATGVQINAIPLTPVRVMEAMQRQK